MLLWETVKIPSCKITFFSWYLFIYLFLEGLAWFSQGSRLLLG